MTKNKIPSKKEFYMSINQLALPNLAQILNESGNFSSQFVSKSFTNSFQEYILPKIDATKIYFETVSLKNVSELNRIIHSQEGTILEKLALIKNSNQARMEIQEQQPVIAYLLSKKHVFKWDKAFSKDFTLINDTPSPVFKEIPKPISNQVVLKNIQDTVQSVNLSIGSMELSNQKISKTPSFVSLFINLDKLSLDKNKLKNLPESLSNLKVLTFLDISGNEFEEIPSVLYLMPMLRTLLANHNNITSVPSDIQKITPLSILGLEKNNIRSVAKEINKLNSIVAIYLKNNELKTFPHLERSLKHCIVQIVNNPLSFIPKSVSDQTNRYERLTYNLDEDIKKLESAFTKKSLSRTKLPTPILSLISNGKKRKKGNTEFELGNTILTRMKEMQTMKNSFQLKSFQVQKDILIRFLSYPASQESEKVQIAEVIESCLRSLSPNDQLITTMIQSNIGTSYEDVIDQILYDPYDPSLLNALKPEQKQGEGKF